MHAQRVDPLVLAVDVGATKTLVTVRPLSAITASDSRWSPGVRARRILTPRAPEDLVRAIGCFGRQLAAAHGGAIVAAGVAAPGPLDTQTGTIVHSPNLGWRDVPLGPWLASELGVPVILEDDATAAALGESRLGAGRDLPVFAYLTLSSGIGAGVVVDGTMLRGAHGLAGEVGHLVVDTNGPRCGCGRRGHVESYAGGASLARRARSAWPRRDGPELPPRDAAGVFLAARRGDPVGIAMAEDAERAVAHAIAVLAAAFDPGVIAVGGAVGLGQPSLVRTATRLARRAVLAETARNLTVRRAALGHESCLAGAAMLGARLA